MLILLLVAMPVLFTGCITLRFHYDDINADQISSIAIYDLRESSDFGSGFYENTEPVYTLEEAQKEPFLEALAKIEFKDTLVLLPVPFDPSFDYGKWVVRINYTDGSYQLISCGGYGETFDANGETTDGNHYGCDDVVWEEFICDYVPAEI